MTITIADGRGALWQWDTGRRVKITDGDGVKQIHYQNRCFGCSVDVDVGDDGTAIIPDELLQDCHTLTAYVYVTDDTGAYTMEQQDFIVHKRAKPAGYVYTPTDQMTLQMIQRQIGDLADLTTEAKENLVAAINEAAASGGAGSMALRVADGYIQYSTDSGSTWQNLIAVAELKGADGSKGDPGIAGQDGHSPVVTAAKSGKTTTISVDGAAIATVEDGAPGIYYGTTKPTGDTHPVWIDPDGVPDDGGLLPAVTAADNGKVLRVVNSAWSAVDMPTGGTDMGITGATVGQIAKITAVADSGKPTAWAAVDMPSGGGGEPWEAINAITLSDAVNTVTINTDSGGNAIALKKVRILVEGSATHNQDLFFNNSRYIRTSFVGTAVSVGAISAEPFCGKMYCFAVPNAAANYAAVNQQANIFSSEITISEIKLIVNNSGTFSAGTKFTIQGVRA